MADVTLIFQQLSFLLAIAVVSHLIFKKLRQPTLIGEIAVGIVMGPSIAGFLLNRDNPSCFPVPAPGAVCPPFDTELIAIFAALGSIFLLFLIGLESDMREIYTRQNIVIAMGGVLLPFVGGFIVAFFLAPEEPLAFRVFLGAILVATSTAIAAGMLLEMGLVHTRVAKAIMGAAVVDDILGLLVLSVAIGIAEQRVDIWDLTVLVGTAIVFIIVGAYLGARFFGRLVVWVQRAGEKLGLRFGGFMLAIAMTFLYGAIAETIGLSAIIGAFVAGTMFAATPLKDDLTRGAERLGSIFVPAFFVSMGLLVNLWTLNAGTLLFGVVLVFVAFFTKVLGCWIPARAFGLPRDEAWAIGYGMAPRGEVGLIVAQTALLAGVLHPEVFSIVVIAMIVVSVIPTPFLKYYLARIRQGSRAAEPARVEGP
jgi:Kef-type K+ transport system membrane component KefB